MHRLSSGQVIRHEAFNDGDDDGGSSDGGQGKVLGTIIYEVS